jgi:hypothetical protein
VNDSEAARWARGFVSATKAQAMRQSKLRADLGNVAAQDRAQPLAAAPGTLLQ